MTKFKLLVLALLILGVTSCSSDDDFTPVVDDPTPDPSLPFSTGVFILNEGGGGATGSLSHLTNDFETLTEDAFGVVNQNEDLGFFVQSMFFDEERAYIISNGSNLITVVDRFSLELIDVIDTGLNVPMFGTVLNGKAYVSNLADFISNQDDYLAVIDLETLSVESTLVLGNTTDYVLSHNNNLYVQNASYGFGNSISKVNPNTLVVTETLEVGEGLSAMRVDGNFLYASTTEALVKVDLTDFSIHQTLPLSENLEGARNLRVFEDQVIFTVGTSAYTTSTSLDILPVEAIFTYSSNSAFGSFYGFDVHNGHIYLSDGVDFASEGFIEVRTLSGDLEYSDTVGIGPNSFYFQ
jgi:hypothetical protein